MFYFGNNSMLQLVGVHPEPIIVITTALLWSEVDFSVIDGLRTKDEQKALVASGASQTMKSWHLPQKDGLGRAIDIQPWVEGKARQDHGLFSQIADAVFEAADHHNVYVEWGASKKIDKRGHFNSFNDMFHWQFVKS